MSFAKLTVSDFIEHLLPDFIVNEFPTFVKFFEEYYKSLEIRGGILDISENIIEYKDLDHLSKNNLIKTSSLDQNISATQTTIRLKSTDGFVKSEGIIQIDNEIIFYKDINYRTKTLLNCYRGYSATTELKDFGTKVQQSVAASHFSGTSVINLSNLFLYSILKNYEEQYLEGFPYKRIDSDIDIVTILENIKDFYSYKGTNVSIQFLFRSIFDEEIEIRYPKDYLIKSSYSDWTVDDIIKVESIIGNPYDLVGNELIQTDITGNIQVTAVVDSILVNNITNYASGNKNIYEIRLNILNRQNFSVPQETILRKQLTPNDTTITVDSTIGFPEENGVIQINNEVITYRYKSFNQFFDCSRGSYNTVASTHQNFTSITTTEYLYGYKSGIKSKINTITMRLLGVMSSTSIVDGSSYYNENENIEISQNGVLDSRKQFTSWRINENGFTATSSNVVINNLIKNIITEIGAVYKTNNFAYVSSTGLPSHPVGPFIGVGNNLSNQFLLKAIPLKTEKVTQLQPVGNRSIGLFVNGVEAYSCQDLESEKFGNIISVELIQNGYGFLDNVQPVFRLLGATGSGATFSANISNGKVLSINVLNGGINYTDDFNLEVAYGFDATATIANDFDIVRGQIRNITVTNGGNNYIVAPNVLITDLSGTGKGAFARANINNGSVTSIDVISGGIDYSNRSNIRISLISNGTGVQATAKVRRWNYDRVFKLKYVRNTSGQWQLSQNKRVDGGNGYLYNSADVRYGLQYAYALNPKLLRSELNDNVKGPSFDYAEIDSNFSHSPILGWAYDGNPIYGPYGYTNPASVSTIRRMVSSYSLNTTTSNRPSVSEYPFGAFIEDYDFVSALGDLDENNGRFCKTPEFPNGTYAYFISVDPFGEGIFPYIIGKNYNSVPSKLNNTISHNQIESNLPQDAKRIRTLNTPNKGFDARILINSVERGSVDSYICSNSSSDYKVNDFLFINSDNTEGSGSLASIESIFGVTVSSVTYAVLSGYTASGVTITNGISQFPYPTKISAPQYSIPYEAIVTTTQPHLLSNRDSVILNIDNNVLQTTKTFKVRVGTYQTIHYTKPNITTTLDVDVSLNQSTINVINASQYRNNDYILINDEIMRIISINYTNNQFTVSRAQLNSPLRLHAATNSVKLYIPDFQNDYNIQIGNSLISSGISGTIYSIDKLNSKIEVKILSGTIINTSVVSDSSTPSARQITISSVTPKKIYWEIDPTNTGNYYVRDLSLDMIRGSTYVFDISDGSNFGNVMSFSEDSSNISAIPNIVRSGTPGVSGSTITINYSIFNINSISRVYYFDKTNRIENNKTYFNIRDNYFISSHVIDVISPTKFKFSISSQLESLSYSNVSYTTTSISSIGKISKIKNIDGGEGYKKLPLVEGIIHSDLDNAKFTYSLSSGSLTNNISVLNQGRRYSSNTILKVISSTGSGAIIKPTIVNGRIVSVEVTNGGRNYTNNDYILAVDTNPEIFPISNTIAKVKTTRFANYGTQYSSDRTLQKQLILNYKLIITNLSNQIYSNSEFLTASNGAVVRVDATQKIGNNSYLLDVKLLTGVLLADTILTGSIRQTTSKIHEVKLADIFGNISGYLSRVGFFDSDLGKLNASSQKIIDSRYYQDFSYVIRSTKSLRDYKSIVDKSLHPLGFKLFGEVSVENFSSITNSGLTGSGSVTLPRDYSANSVIVIPVSGITVESQLSYRKYEVQIVNTALTQKIEGLGASLLNFLDNQVEAVKLTDISNTFDNVKTNYPLTTQDGTFPENIKNTSILLAINEIFQEPYELRNISDISYVNNLATITTVGDHGYAYTYSGVTYPTDLYVHISGVTPSGNINFNDKFEIYSVNSSNTFTVLFNNPNGYLTNNDPGVCADVQNTVDNLVGILTTKLANPSGITLPIRNTGIWTTSGVSTIVSANRHRDASALISANKQEIVDRANAEISVLFPDFYYPNDPQTTDKSRFKDSYRLIQQNRREIIDRAAAEIAVQHPDFSYPGDPQTTAVSRFKDGYRLIQLNRQEIIDTAFAAIAPAFPTFVINATNTDKCKRDIGIFIDSVSLDIAQAGGNVYSRQFVLSYFNNGSPITNGLVGEEAQSVLAFNKARDEMKKAVANQLTIKDLTITSGAANYGGTGGNVSNTSPTACSDIQTAITNLTLIITSHITAGNVTGLPAESVSTTVPAGEAKCKRDIGIFIDAVSLDVHVGSNRYVIEFLKQYFNATGTSLTSNGLQGEIAESITAFNKARDVMKLAITNQLFTKDLTITADPLPASGVSSNTNPTSCTNVRNNIDILSGIVTFHLNQGSLTYPTPIPAVSSGTTASGETKCKRDIGIIVDAVVLDLFYGGNSNILDATNSYLTTSGNTLISNGVQGEVSESIVAFNKAKNMMKLALANQLYVKDFNILPDFLGTSDTILSSRLTNAKVIKGQFEFNTTNNTLRMYEPPKEGSTFYSVLYKLTNSSDDIRYSYKLKNILFDGVTKEFNLYKLDGANLVTEQDENLLIFVDGVLQIYGESYIINRSVYPNKIVFYESFDASRNFFGYSFSKYKMLNNISDQFNDRQTVFELKYQDDIIKLPDVHQLLILLDGVPQNENDTYTISDNILTFKEAPTKGKKCNLLYFYGKTFDKTISIWNGKVFEDIHYIGENTIDGCRYLKKVNQTYEYLKPGDLIKIQGETPKELISIEQNVLEQGDDLLYTAFVYTDNSYIKGKNAVATAVVSGVAVSGANPVSVSGTTSISGTVSIPSVYNNLITRIDVNNGGMEYETAPIVLFKPACGNPGTGAEAYSTIQNGRVVSVTITNPGSGYTTAPEIIFAKRYELIRKKPVYDFKDIIIDMKANDGIALLTSAGLTGSTAIGSEEKYEIPVIQTSISSTKVTTIETENRTNRDVSRPALAYVLNTFEENKFKYEPLNINDPLSSYLGTNVNIENVSRYAPNLTIADFVNRPGSTTGASDNIIINYGEDSYISFGLTLASGITDLDQTILISGNTYNLPPSGYIEFGDETIFYSSIFSGQLLNCQRGVLNTSSTSHNQGDYMRLAWRGW